jgi:hypothetical protein
MISQERLLFASIADSLNLNRMKFAPGSASVFDSEFISVTTGDAGIFANVSNILSLAQVGLPMNLDPLPDAAALGLDAIGEGLGHSVWATLFRVAGCGDSQDCRDYFETLQPVLRLTPRPGSSCDASAFSPLPMSPLLPRSSADPESALDSEFKALWDAVSAWLTLAALPPVKTEQLAALPLVGRDCIKHGTNCIGDCGDALYTDGNEPLTHLHSHLHSEFDASVTPNGSSFLIDFGESILVVGLQHSRTGKASYNNVAIYDVKRALGILALMDLDMQGSASFFGFSSPNAEKFYAHAFSRNCPEVLQRHCTAVPFHFPGLPWGERLTVVERAYVDPHSGTNAPRKYDTLRIQAIYSLSHRCWSCSRLHFACQCHCVSQLVMSASAADYTFACLWM